MMSLDKLPLGQPAEVIEVRSSNPARLDRLCGFGIVPGSFVRLAQRHPALVVQIDETEVSMDSEVAREIWVMLGD